MNQRVENQSDSEEPPPDTTSIILVVPLSKRLAEQAYKVRKVLAMRRAGLELNGEAIESSKLAGILSTEVAPLTEDLAHRNTGVVAKVKRILEIYTRDAICTPAEFQRAAYDLIGELIGPEKMSPERAKILKELIEPLYNGERYKPLNRYCSRPQKI